MTVTEVDLNAFDRRNQLIMNENDQEIDQSFVFYLSSAIDKCQRVVLYVSSRDAI